MSRMSAIAAALAASSGMSLGDIARAIGQTSLTARNSISAALCTMAKAGRVHHNNQPARSGRRLWYASANAQTDRRLAIHRHGTAMSGREAAQHRAPAKAAAVNPPKPPASANMQIVKRKPAPMSAPASVQPQTVAEFLAAGGHIERLAPHASSKPLRFDHSNPRLPLCQRHPTQRRAKAGAP